MGSPALLTCSEDGSQTSRMALGSTQASDGCWRPRRGPMKFLHYRGQHEEDELTRQPALLVDLADFDRADLSVSVNYSRMACVVDITPEAARALRGEARSGGKIATARNVYRPAIIMLSLLMLVFLLGVLTVVVGYGTGWDAAAMTAAFLAISATVGPLVRRLIGSRDDGNGI